MRLFSSDSEPVVITEKKGQVLFIRLNRPKKYNAVNQEVYDGIVDGLNEAAKDSEVKFTVVTGNGKYFSSGSDLRKFRFGWNF